ncbi:MAG: hypothetical protein ACI4N3_02610 [Alphaproteobacteria bacterium]
MNIINFPNYVDAQIRNRKASSSSVNSRKTNSRNVAKTVNTVTNTATENNSKNQEIDVSTITKYNCEKLYNQCMNKTCYNKSNGRCDCNNQTKFNEANKLCEYITNACPSQANDIVKTFARNASNDCRSIALAKNEDNLKNINNYLADTLACLKPKCRANRTDEFAGCFDEDNLKNRLEICKNSFSGVSDLDEFNKLIQQSFLTYKEKYCKEMFGTLKEDGNCYLTIGIGVASGDIKKTKEFKTGDKIVCSSKAFNTSMGEDTASKLSSVKNITLSGLSLVQQGLSIASTAVGGKTAKTVNGVQTVTTSATAKTIVGSEVLGMASTALGSVEDIATLAKKDYSYTGKCFVINNGKAHELFPENDDIAYKLRWAESWKEQVYEN